jgi:hypothetical protein
MLQSCNVTLLDLSHPENKGGKNIQAPRFRNGLQDLQCWLLHHYHLMTTLFTEALSQLSCGISEILLKPCDYLKPNSQPRTR